MPGNAIVEEQNEGLKFNRYKMPAAPNNTHDIHSVIIKLPGKSMFAGMF